MLRRTFFVLWTLLLAIRVASRLVNRTIDDQNGDNVDGTMLSYYPASEWAQGSTCRGCGVHPGIVDPRQTFGGTWHDSTYHPGGGEHGFTVTFTGTAVYVYHLVANVIPYITTLTNVNFYLDSQPVGQFVHYPDPLAPNIIEYNVLVYSTTDLPNTRHDLIVYASGDEDSLILFDYVVYTAVEADVTAETNISSQISLSHVFPTAVSIATSSPESASTSSSSTPMPPAASSSAPPHPTPSSMTKHSTALSPIPSRPVSSPSETVSPSPITSAPDGGEYKFAVIAIVAGSSSLILIPCIIFMWRRRAAYKRRPSDGPKESSHPASHDEKATVAHSEREQSMCISDAQATYDGSLRMSQGTGDDLSMVPSTGRSSGLRTTWAGIRKDVAAVLDEVTRYRAQARSAGRPSPASASANSAVPRR
ncbi:hypothetical protein C8Q76DRAFT_365887 [Earliella scabrosa]|nr:hypothetical protein C8Q76DRAFT_365887 [Earliella scabrosa]